MKIFQYLILSISLIAGSRSFSQDTIYIEKDTKAPFSGILFTETKAREIKIQLEERDTFKLLNESYTRSLDLTISNMRLKDEQLDLVLKQNTKLSMALRDQKDFNTWERIGWFALGVVATSFAVYGVKQAAR
jgi:hypothetical protein